MQDICNEVVEKNMMKDIRLDRKPAFDFFSKVLVMFLGLNFLFLFFRIYLFQNLVLPKESFKFIEAFQSFLWGLRFDLCVTGFLLMPLFFIFCVTLVLPEKWGRKYLFYLGYFYISLVFILSFAVYYFNLPFIIKNAGFGIPYWMRWQDYQSLYDLSIYPSYWHFDYVSEIQVYHVILMVIFSLISSMVLIPVPNIQYKKTYIAVGFYFLAIALMARGKWGQHHIRFEDSRFSESVLLNELSLNPLWLIDKSKEQLSQDQVHGLKPQ